MTPPTLFSASPVDAVEAQVVKAGVNIIVTDLPAPLVLPTFTRVTLTSGNAIADINASGILKTAWNAGQIKLYLNGMPVTAFPPLTAAAVPVIIPSGSRSERFGANTPIDVVEAETIKAGANVIVEDLPVEVIIPTFMRATLTVGSNTVAGINASQTLIDAWNAGEIRLYLNGLKVIAFPPLQTSLPITETQADVIQTPTPTPVPLPTQTTLEPIPVGFEPLIGVVDGSNKIFSIANLPIAGSVQVYNNGLALDLSSTGDVKVSGNKVIFGINAIPQPGDDLTASYSYQPLL